MKIRTLLQTLAFVLSSGLALAGSGTVTVLDSTGSTQTFDVTTDGSGHFVAKNVICDQSAAANCAGVDSGHGLQTTVNTWASGTLGSMANYGTSPGAVLVPGVNAFVTNANANGQAAMANSSPVAIASDQSVADPCMFQAKSNAAFSSNPNNANVALVAGVSAKKIYVCSFSVIAAAATAVSLTEGSGTTCGTSNQAAVIGVASNGTLANGMSLAANGGLTLGNGTGTIAKTATNADYLCIAGSASANLAGNITYVQQ